MVHLVGKAQVLLSLLAVTVLAETDMIDRIDHFIAKLMAGVELTASYTFSLGRAYPPIDQDVTFWCIKPESGWTELKQTFFNDPDIQSKIDFTKPVNFVIHGWLGGLNGGNMYLPSDVRPKTGWMRATAGNWSKFTNSNACSVDWSRLANYDYSVAAMRHTKMVTDALEYFMRYLITNGMDITKVSIAGHSLGAQIAGYIGNKFNGQIDSIYGMDPAGPGFTFPFDLGGSTRLDPSDAKYVQCLHTSRGTLGTMKDCGHADFISNSGYVQPGCMSVMCSHSRSHDFFLESLNPSNIFRGEKCSGSFRSFFSGLFGKTCTDESDRLGIYSARKTGRYFMKTKSSSPYALNSQ